MEQTLVGEVIVQEGAIKDWATGIEYNAAKLGEIVNELLTSVSTLGDKAAYEKLSRLGEMAERLSIEARKSRHYLCPSCAEPTDIYGEGKHLEFCPVVENGSPRDFAGDVLGMAMQRGGSAIVAGELLVDTITRAIYKRDAAILGQQL